MHQSPVRPGPSRHPLAELRRPGAANRRRGIPSVCSAHPLVLEAALLEAAENGTPVLIEATCNQVNHEGGYTGLTPAAFRDAVLAIAAKVGLPPDRILLGGDHLGPNPWKTLEAEEAMRRSEQMVAAYVEAGFTKIHLDTSMGCRGEPVALADQTTSARAARLAATVEAVATRCKVEPWYIIGTEVPTPGGALEAIDTLAVTRPESAAHTVEVHRRAFESHGVGGAFARVVGLVVQPGVEFGSENVVSYVPERAAALSAVLADLPGIVFEAHSTDYQSLPSLTALVQGGFAILKVGPALTFAMREALYGLDAIAGILFPERPSLVGEMENIMLAQPGNWRSHYHGSNAELRAQRHFSYSDRIRYYWPHPRAARAVEQLLIQLEAKPLPETLISQYLPRLYARVRSGDIAAQPRALVVESIRDVLRLYAAACR